MDEKDNLEKIDTKDEQKQEKVNQSEYQNKQKFGNAHNKVAEAKENTESELNDFSRNELLNDDIYFFSNEDMLFYIKSLKEHILQYSKLLKSYVESSSRNLKIKQILKISFVILCMGILIGLTVLLVFISYYCLKNNVTQNTAITVVVANIISFLTTFIVLPSTIVKYLFDSNEENNVFEIIKNMQNFDENMNKMLNKISNK